jgi:acetyl esterase/lipase
VLLCPADCLKNAVIISPFHPFFVALRDNKSISIKFKQYMKNRKLLLVAGMLSVAMVSFAQKPIYYSLWPNGAPNDNEITAEETTTVPWRNVKTARLTIYKSDKPDSKCIIMCPGGGYGGEYWQHEGINFAPWMHNLNITYMVLKYRLPNVGHHEVPLSDVQEALREVRSHAKEWNVNPNAVGIMGCSAGGHLAASGATLFTNDANRFDFQVLLYPVITMNELTTHKGTRQSLIGMKPTKKLIDRYSLEKQVTDRTPRAFIVLASDDKTVPPVNSLDYAKALVDHKIPVDLVMYPYGGHGFGFNDSFAFKNQWLGELEKWLRTF